MYPQYGPPPPGYYPPPQPMYPGPQPVMYVAQAPPPGRNTQEGVKFMSYYILLGIITNLIGFMLALLALVSPAAVIGLSCVIGGLALLVFLMFIISMAKYWEGKHEFGPAHEHNVKSAVYMFILIIIMTCVVMSFSMFAGISMALSGNLSQGIFMIVVVSAVTGIINSILWGLIMMSLGKQFMTADEISRAYMAIILMVLGSVVSMAITMYMFSTTNLITSTSTSYMSYIGGIFTILGNLIFYLIYKNILARFISGQIRPPAPPMMGYPPGPVPIGPVYGPPPGYPPTYPI